MFSLLGIVYQVYQQRILGSLTESHYLLVSEGPFSQFLIQLFLEDLKLCMSFSQLLLELGDLLSVLLILSPAEYDSIYIKCCV